MGFVIVKYGFCFSVVMLHVALVLFVSWGLFPKATNKFLDRIGM